MTTTLPRRRGEDIARTPSSDSHPSLTSTALSSVSHLGQQHRASSKVRSDDGGGEFDVQAAREAKKRLGFGFSKSVSSLRGRAKGDEKRATASAREKERSALGKRANLSNPSYVPPPFPLPTCLNHHSIPSLPLLQVHEAEQALDMTANHRVPAKSVIINNAPRSAQPAMVKRPEPQRSGGGFSSFIRKLTGRSASPPKPTPPPQRSGPPVKAAPMLEAMRKPVLHVETGRSARYEHPQTAPPVLAPALPVMQPQQQRPREPPVRPVAPKADVQVDPAQIPLPASPISPCAPLPTFELVKSPVDAPARPVEKTAPPHIRSQPSIKRVTPMGMLSLEGVGMEEDDQDTEEHLQPVVDERDEDSDEIAELPSSRSGLAPIRIPSRRETNNMSPSTAASENLMTPTSESESFGGARSPIDIKRQISPSDTKRGSSTSPQRRGQPAPIAFTGGELGRKESKWRRSVMDLSGVS